MRSPLVRLVVLVASLVALFPPAATPGTTGFLSGTLRDSETHAPVEGALISAVSPSQSASTITDSKGGFSFVSLAPDTYTISAGKDGFDPSTLAGLTVLADQQQTIAIVIRRSARLLGRVGISAQSTSTLVKPGTTANVYSIGATQQGKFAGVGGGGGLNNAYSAIATVPGVFVPFNSQGYFQTTHIRGGDFDEIGYELDGIPINRAYDNDPGGAVSSLGEQELQVYTGAAPANAGAQGLAGFINQVIRTGTYPGFANFVGSVGGPALYNKASIEAGGATPDRNFTYYTGLGGYNQQFRYVDQFNGSSLASSGPIVNSLPCPTNNPIALQSYVGCYANGFAGPAGFTQAPITLFQVSSFAVRNTVANFHVEIPHHYDSGKDDIQLLYTNDYLLTKFFSSPNDIGIQQYGGVGNGWPPLYTDAYQYTVAPGSFLASNYQALTSPYLYPSSSAARSFGAPIPFTAEDGWQNNLIVGKLQYQKNFGTTKYLRVYGFMNYSDYFVNGANSAWLAAGTFGIAPITSLDYELDTHARGVSATFADQIDSKNLVQLQGTYTFASFSHINNTQPFQQASFVRNQFATVVDSTNPTNGVCYAITAIGGNPVSAAPAVCDSGAPPAIASTYATFTQAAAGTIPFTGPGANNISNVTCGAGPCRWFVVEDGAHGGFNGVTPKFWSGSLTDIWKPTDKLVINIGVRYDFFQYLGSDTTATSARTLFFNAFNQDNCVPTTGLQIPVYKPTIGVSVLSPCPPGFAPVNLINAPTRLGYQDWQPRAGLTYSLNPDTVLRASAGRYAQAPISAYEQYDTLEQNLPNTLGTNFYAFGFHAPGHAVRPAESNNYDFSLEHHLPRTDVSFKLTPFYRYTQNQVENVLLNPTTLFISGLNAERLTSRGIEFQLNKGDLAANGFAGQLTFSYTNAYAQYNEFANGTNVFSALNNDIKNYNAYTSFCAANPADAHCGSTSSGLTSARCYTTAGVADPGCASGDIANPYWYAPVQSLLDPNARYIPYTFLPGGLAAGLPAESYLAPYVSTLLLQYKHGRFSVDPALQFQGGTRYGMPEISFGVDPASGCGALGGSTTNDPRYPYGSAGGAPYDASTCAATISIPNQYTKQFDPLGSFVNPSHLLANVQLSYQATDSVSLVATFVNVINNCFGGTTEPWTGGGSRICSYNLPNNGVYAAVGNVYNPASIISPYVKYPYVGQFGDFNTDFGTAQITNPFSMFFAVRVKL